MQILAISGSLRASSSNTTILRALAGLAPPDIEVTLYHALADLPHFSPDLDGPNPPPPVEYVRGLIQKAGGVIICTPEYAYGMPGALKNLLDWTVSSGEFFDKPVATISASPGALGGEKAHAALLLTLSALAAKPVEDGKLTIPLVRTKLNDQGELTDPATIQALKTMLLALAQA
jgi:NAD(P)H-dependent FMN reductase